MAPATEFPFADVDRAVQHAMRAAADMHAPLCKSKDEAVRVGMIFGIDVGISMALLSEQRADLFRDWLRRTVDQDGDGDVAETGDRFARNLLTAVAP